MHGLRELQGLNSRPDGQLGKSMFKKHHNKTKKKRIEDRVMWPSVLGGNCRWFGLTGI